MDECVCTHCHYGRACDEPGCGCTLFELLADPNVANCSFYYRTRAGYTTSHPFGSCVDGSKPYPIGERGRIPDSMSVRPAESLTPSITLEAAREIADAAYAPFWQS